MEKQIQANDNTKPQRNINMVAQYIKDLSFENPNAPESLNVDADSGAEVGFEMASNNLSEYNLFEIEMRVSIKMSHPKKGNIFMLEIVYGAAFELENVEESDVEYVILVRCPDMMFGYLRKLTADIIREGGFPPISLDHIDFENMYLSKKYTKLD